MKKLIIIILAIIGSLNAKAQKLIAYVASNGITYHLKDTVHLGRGSAPNGTFLYLQMGGWAAIASYSASDGPNANNIGRGYANTAVIVKKINQTKIKGIVKVYFTVGGGNITNYLLYIEDAIQTCEVTPCTAPDNNQQIVADKFDLLKKLKGLLDSGAITQTEYDEQKKKILNQ
ncbi:MAG: hypothetical protein JWQ63_918 [Mucilaginibacter sp.]|nr:hypothetical protein [Mucilaginibacter sp.]